MPQPIKFNSKTITDKIKNILSLPSAGENKFEFLFTIKSIKAIHSEPRIFSNISRTGDDSVIFIIGFVLNLNSGITI